MKQVHEMLASIVPVIELIREQALQSGQLAVVEDCQRAMQKIVAVQPQSSNPLTPVLYDILRRLSPYHEELKRTVAVLTHFVPKSWGVGDEQVFQALARRLVAMRLFLDGDSGGGGFKAISTTAKGDISVGLGLKLSDGSLQKFLSSLLQETGASAEAFFAPFFDDDASDLLNAIAGGQAALAEYLQSQLVLRYDPVLFEKRYELPLAWRAKFQRLSTSSLAQDAQVVALAGSQFERTKQKATLGAIRSLRGFAMLFDLDEKTTYESVEAIASRGDEQQKMLSLSDSVLSRMHGRLAEHWQSRMQSVFDGYGNVEGRLYDERRFLGQRADLQTWDSLAQVYGASEVMARPKAGYDYIVKPGDRLSTLVRDAYDGKGDYRFVLRQNPHIDIRSELSVGSVIYFPEMQSQTRRTVADLYLPTRLDEDGMLRLYDRSVGPLTAFAPAQLKLLEAKLADLPLHALNSCVAVRLAEHMALLCANEALLMVDDEVKERIKSALQGDEDAAFRYLEALAAQIRGDLCVFDHIYLPLGTVLAEPFRRHWLKNTLERALAHPQFKESRLALNPQSYVVDLVDVFSQTLIRLEAVDILAIRMQPLRRLNDLQLPPAAAAGLLARLWCSDLAELGGEILLPPLSRAFELTSTEAHKEILYNVAMGTPVYPTMRGKVVNCGELEGYGLCVLIEHSHGLYSRYSHLATLGVQPEQNIEAEQSIGRSGVSGEALQPVLGFTLEYRPKPWDSWYCAEAEILKVENYLNTLWPQMPYFELMVTLPDEVQEPKI
ncbi:MAG: M23 family metallopeptidase [Bradymonadales bacterium]